MPSSRPLQPPYSVNSTVFCTYASCQLIFSTSSSLQFWKPPVLTGGFYLIPFLSLWVPTLSPRTHCHMTWGLHAWHWSNPGSAIRTSHLAVPLRSAHLLGYPWPQAPDSCSWLLRSLKGSPPPFFSDPYLSYCSLVLWLPVLPDRGSHNLKPSRVKTIQYCVRLGSGARWTAFLMVPGLQTYHLHGFLASLVTNGDSALWVCEEACGVCLVDGMFRLCSLLFQRCHRPPDSIQLNQGPTSTQQTCNQSLMHF